MFKLLNAAVIPQPGVYVARAITEDEFVDLLRAQGFESYIGYPATATHIQQIAAVAVPLSRAPVALEDGDRMLVCRLKYRLQDTSKKADKDFVPARDDYEYLLVRYWAALEDAKDDEL